MHLVRRMTRSHSWDGETMPYLSRVWLNPLRTGAQRLLRNPHAVHAAVSGGLPAQPVDERLLWRLDVKKRHRAELLILTQTEPSWLHIVESAGWPDTVEGAALVRDYQPFLDRLAPGQSYAFRLRANPVQSTKRPEAPSSRQQQRLDADGRHRGVVVPHRTASQQTQWFLDRMDRWGFEVMTNADGSNQAGLEDRGRLVFSKGPPSHRSRIVLTTATLEGAVRIADATRVREVLLSGVGKGRAYGCGLITLAPLSGAGV